MALLPIAPLERCRGQPTYADRCRCRHPRARRLRAPEHLAGVDPRDQEAHRHDRRRTPGSDTSAWRWASRACPRSRSPSMPRSRPSSAASPPSTRTSRAFAPLKREIARFVKNFLDVTVDPEHCLPTVGSMMGAMACFLTHQSHVRQPRGHAVHRSRVPGAEAAVPRPRPRLHELRRLRLPGPQAARQAAQLPRHRQGVVDPLLQSEQSRLDLFHGGGARDHRQPRRPIRRRRDRGPGLLRDGLPARLLAPWRGAVPAVGRASHGQLRAPHLQLQGVQLRGRTDRHAGGVGRAVEQAGARSQAVLPVRPARLRDGVRGHLRAVVRRLALRAVRPGRRAQGRERRRGELRGRRARVRREGAHHEADVHRQRLPDRLRHGPRRAHRRRVLLHVLVSGAERRGPPARAALLRCECHRPGHHRERRAPRGCGPAPRSSSAPSSRR